MLQGLWERLGIPRTIAKARGSRRVRFDVERALFVLVANRACVPASKLHCFRQWLAEEVRLEGAGGLTKRVFTCQRGRRAKECGRQRRDRTGWQRIGWGKPLAGTSAMANARIAEDAGR